MSSDPSPSNPSTTANITTKPHHRILACVLCQQRKVKCDRHFPCANCTKAGVTCVPASLAQRRRRRRFPERELLDRLRLYENLLRRHKVPFEPLHGGTGAGGSGGIGNAGGGVSFKGDGMVSDEDEGESVMVGNSPSEREDQAVSAKNQEVKNIWSAMSQGLDGEGNISDFSHDEVPETAVKKAWEKEVVNDSHLLFGSRTPIPDLSSTHPDPIQIFRLWQIYLDNVNPLLKVTHTTSLQGRIIQAASNIDGVGRTMEALMFGIYCTAIHSLSEEDCQAMFGSLKEDLLTRYQLACQEALYNSAFLRTGDRDCLTALYLYLISVRPKTSPESLSSMLGVAIRIAQRMGINNESMLATCTVLEAEMRRRLWWSLMLFDSRMTELSSAKVVTLDPSWDCRIPLNVSDTDLRAEMKTAPPAQRTTTEALFVVVRGELGDFTRHTNFYLDYTSPVFKPIAKHLQTGSTPDVSELVKLEKAMEEQYLRHCDEENPVHFMTLWMTRAYLAKCHLMEHHAKYSDGSIRQTEVHLDAATSYALRILECDTKIMASPLVKGFAWLNQLYFPFLAYLQIVQDLRRRPMMELAQRCWAIMNDNHDAWFGSKPGHLSFVFQMFAKVVLGGWKAYEAAYEQAGKSVTPPKIISSIRATLATMAQHAQDTGTQQPAMNMDMGIDELLTMLPTPTSLTQQSSPYTMGMQDVQSMANMNIYSSLTAQRSLYDPSNQAPWRRFGGWPGWQGS